MPMPKFHTELCPIPPLRSFLTKFYHLKSCMTNRSITFAKYIFLHSLTVTLSGKHYLFWIWGTLFLVAKPNY